MSEVKHTPGPWVISELNDAIDGEENIMIEHEGFPLCEVRGTNDMPWIDEDDISTINSEVIANAKLIAAAPDLLSALWEIMRFHSSMETVMGNALQSPENFLNALEQAREALKKATE